MIPGTSSWLCARTRREINGLQLHILQDYSPRIEALNAAGATMIYREKVSDAPYWLSASTTNAWCIAECTSRGMGMVAAASRQ